MSIFLQFIRSKMPANERTQTKPEHLQKMLILSIAGDETGHNRDGKKQWMWGFVSSTAAYFSIQASRGR